MPRRILVTGAAGFVGRFALEALRRDLDPDDHVLATRLLPEGGDRAAAEWRRLDILDRDGVEATVAAYGPTHVLHLAAAASVASASTVPAEAWEVNFVGTFNLARALARRAPGATFLFVSSSEVYGRAFRSGEPVTEAARPEPSGVYGRSKLACETMLADAMPANRLIVVRPFNHIGPGQDERFAAASFAGQIARAETGKGPAVVETGDLRAERDILDVRDVVRAYAALIRGSDALPRRALYNVCSGTTRPMRDIVDAMRGMARVAVEIRTAPERLRSSDIPHACGDGGALRDAIGWQPACAFEDTVRSVLADARSRNPP